MEPGWPSGNLVEVRFKFFLGFQIFGSRSVSKFFSLVEFGLGRGRLSKLPFS